MTLIRTWLLVAAAVTGSVAFATEVRTIAPASHSLFPTAPVGTEAVAKAGQDAAALKPAAQGVPSPILVDRTVTIANDGRLRFGCGNQSLRDFRQPATAAGSAQVQR